MGAIFQFDKIDNDLWNQPKGGIQLKQHRNFVHLTANPCKMCMPMGASLAFKGIENCMILLHGSQGCSTYIRRHISAHYNEPVDIASSSLTESGTVYGGADNLKKGLNNLLRLYQPKCIGVITTCLAETIGEDIERITREYLDEYEYDVDLVPVHTPGYGASQYEGYYFALRKIVEYYVKGKKYNNKINIIVSDLSPGDVRELKRILNLFKINYIMLPDISDTLDSPFAKEYNKIPSGGTKLEEIEEMGGSQATIELGKLVADEYSPGVYLENAFNVPLYRCPIPIGLENTDLLYNILSELSGNPIPDELLLERGRMLDAMIDSHKYNGRGVAAIFGTPEIIYSVSSLCMENGIQPRIVATGSKLKQLSEILENKISTGGYDSLVLDDTDFLTIEKQIDKKGINILIGHSDGKFIMEKKNIPLIRIGFPVHDHVGAQRRVNIGYQGSLRLLDDITNALLDELHHSYRKNMLETYFTFDSSPVI